MGPSPKSLILDLLSSMRGQAMPVGALITAGALFGIEENSLRVALARLVNKGLVSRNDTASYRLGPAAAGVQTQVSNWRRIGERTVAWQGGWIAVHTAALGRSDRKKLRKRSRASRLLGFREFCAGLELRPDNLEEGLDGVRQRLYQLGLEAHAPVARLQDLDPSSEATARSLWNTRLIRSRYRDITRSLGASLARIHEMPVTEAMRETFVLGGEAIRELVLDPLLPDELVPAAERDALVEAASRYDTEGKKLWSSFMKRYDVTSGDSPADTGDLYQDGRIAMMQPGALT